MVGFAWLLACTASVAAAQDTPITEDEARGLFAAGQAAYDEGRYDRAYELFSEAYAASDRPELLYNMALAADRAGRADEAISAYERFASAVPDHPRIAFVRTRIADLRSSEDGGPGALPWITLGAGIAVLATGAVLFGLSFFEDATVQDAPAMSSWSDVSGAYDRIIPFQVGGGVAIGVGATGVVLGVVLALDGGDGGS